MNTVLVTQGKGYTAAWAAPEILEGADRITREADMFAFGMVVMEVGSRTSPQVSQGGGLGDLPDVWILL